MAVVVGVQRRALEVGMPYVAFCHEVDQLSFDCNMGDAYHVMGDTSTTIAESSRLRSPPMPVGKRGTNPAHCI